MEGQREAHARLSARTRLFVGEDESTRDLREVESWIGVYTELAEFCERALAEVGEASRAPLQDWREHFDERLSTWRKRRDELRSA
jgi:hypothetical protein